MNIEKSVRTVKVTRYVTPLREGGSLPAIIEADDDGLYVLKFRGAGQGPKALIAELIAGEIARRLGLQMPDIVLADLDKELGRTEPDPEIQDLIKASVGWNLAVDYLPGSITFDPLVDKIDEELASRIVWFDAFVTNVDRTARNPNMLIWHKELWLIDHGAALYFQHAWDNWEQASQSPFIQIKDHVLLPRANAISDVDKELRECLTREVFENIVSSIPDEWLDDFDPAARRSIYVEFLQKRLGSANIFVEEAKRARENSI